MFRELQRLSENVWIFPTDDNANTVQPAVGIIKTPTQTILVDGGNSPRHARQVMAEMVGLGFPPIETIIYTHHHWDHVFGAMTFNPRTVIAHEACATHLHQMSLRSWGTLSLREEMYRNPLYESRNTAINQAMGDWRDFRIVQPSITFSTTLSLYPKTPSTINLVHVGGIHADDSIVVQVPSEGVMFLGDSFYGATVFDQRTDGVWDNQRLRDAIHPEFHTFVEGHGNPLNYEQLMALLNSSSARSE